jgi:uncharacterized protein (DUF1015 family)
MAHIRPFAGVHFNKVKFPDVSAMIAPPYDVLDEAGKAALQAKSPHNIVTIDLPHLPPKSVGPDETYTKAAKTMEEWLASGVLLEAHARHRDAALVDLRSVQRPAQRGHIAPLPESR